MTDERRRHATDQIVPFRFLLGSSVHSYNQLMKDFPLNDLLSATGLERMKDSLVLIFKHLSNKLKLS